MLTVPRRPRVPPEPETAALYWSLSPNQIVAYNLTQARFERQWTQDEAAEALEPYLGALWSRAVWSAAERSVDGSRVRLFTADDIVAFARGFDLPITYFFLPPPPWVDGRPVKLDTPDTRAQFGETMATMIDLIFGTPEQAALVSLRMQSFLVDLGEDLLSNSQHRVASLAADRITGVARVTLSRLGKWQTNLRSIANQLQDLETRAKHHTATDLNVDERDL